VIQGPVLSNDSFTLETIRLYKKIFPQTVIILSTWEDTSPEDIEKIQAENISIVFNKKPELPGQQNINYQIVSTRSGIARAKELGVNYVLKSRSDQRIYQPGALDFLHTLINFFSIKEGFKQQKRIIGMSLNTFKYRLYGLSDMFLFGHIDDLTMYWNADLDERAKGINEPFNYLKVALCEVYLVTKFLKNIGREVRWTLEDSWKVFAEHFCVVDESSIDIYWYKYARMREYRYRNYTVEKEKMELTFPDWLRLYTNFEQIIIPSGYDIP
jgi:hypothetical protein